MCRADAQEAKLHWLSTRPARFAADGLVRAQHSSRAATEVKADLSQRWTGTEQPLEEVTIDISAHVCQLNLHQQRRLRGKLLS